MQIIIPMSGFGERFRKKGYELPKPLIKVDGRPIIEYVVRMFPGEHQFFFVCNENHLNNKAYEMRTTLNNICPSGTIIGIEPHRLGPIHACQAAIPFLNLTAPVIINYCDFTCDWDYTDFEKFVLLSDCDGAIPVYKGFHPHTVWSSNYAYIAQENMRAINVQEKKPFTKSPKEEYASSGTYYFKSAIIMQEYLLKCIASGLSVGDEYYVSMAFKPMIEEGREVLLYELAHFMQWGVPADLEEYQYWSGIFSTLKHQLAAPKKKMPATLLLLMAGEGQRFKKSNYTLSKPEIPVLNKPMAAQALTFCPNTKHTRVITRAGLDSRGGLQRAILKERPEAEFTTLSGMTEGQAITCLTGSEDLDDCMPVTITSCDTGMIYDYSQLQKLMTNESIDVIAWVAKNYPRAHRRADQYSWAEVDKDSGLIKRVSTKRQFRSVDCQAVVVGWFTFKALSDYRNSVKSLVARQEKVNGEYYIDTAINDAVGLGLKCAAFEVDYFVSWGTPEELETFHYWESCFDAWELHTYSR